MAVPTLDAPLAEWGNQFKLLGTAQPADFGLVASQMTQFNTLYTAFNTAYLASKAAGAKNKALVQAKNDAKKDLLTYARELYAFIQASLTVTNENKTLIGVKVRSTEPTPIPPPGLAPLMTVVSVTGRVVRYLLKDASAPGSRRRPINAAGATVLTYVGSNPPASNDPGWVNRGQSGRTTVLVQFPNDVAPGEKCWATAVWYNVRGEYSPACEPVMTYLQVGPVSEAA